MQPRDGGAVGGIGAFGVSLFLLIDLAAQFQQGAVDIRLHPENLCFQLGDLTEVLGFIGGSPRSGGKLFTEFIKKCHR